MSTTSGTAADLVEMMKRKCPEYLDLITAETDEEFETAFEAVLEEAVDHLETNSKNYAVLQEEGLTAVFKSALTIPGLTITQEANSNGHVDLTIEATHCSPQRKKLLEAKIYDGFVYHIKGLKQLLERYMTGRERRSLLVVYVKQPGIADKMRALRERMDKELPLKQKGAATEHHRLKWSFATVHGHDCGDDCAVDHIGCNLFYAGT